MSVLATVLFIKHAISVLPRFPDGNLDLDYNWEKFYTSNNNEDTSGAQWPASTNEVVSSWPEDKVGVDFDLTKFDTSWNIEEMSDAGSDKWLPQNENIKSSTIQADDGEVARADPPLASRKRQFDAETDQYRRQRSREKRVESVPTPPVTVIPTERGSYKVSVYCHSGKKEYESLTEILENSVTASYESLCSEFDYAGGWSLKGLVSKYFNRVNTKPATSTQMGTRTWSSENHSVQFTAAADGAFTDLKIICKQSDGFQLNITFYSAERCSTMYFLNEPNVDRQTRDCQQWEQEFIHREDGLVPTTSVTDLANAKSHMGQTSIMLRHYVRTVSVLTQPVRVSSNSKSVIVYCSGGMKEYQSPVEISDKFITNANELLCREFSQSGISVRGPVTTYFKTVTTGANRGNGVVYRLQTGNDQFVIELHKAADGESTDLKIICKQPSGLFITVTFHMKTRFSTKYGGKDPIINNQLRACAEWEHEFLHAVTGQSVMRGG